MKATSSNCRNSQSPNCPTNCISYLSRAHSHRQKSRHRLSRPSNSYIRRNLRPATSSLRQSQGRMSSSPRPAWSSPATFLKATSLLPLSRNTMLPTFRARPTSTLRPGT
jgi:hypothetical protein